MTEEANTLFLPLNALGGGDPRYFLKTVALSKVEWSSVNRNVFSLHEESTSCPKRKIIALKCLIAYFSLVFKLLFLSLRKLSCPDKLFVGRRMINIFKWCFSLFSSEMVGG